MRKGLIYMSKLKNIIVTIMVILVLAAPVLCNEWGARYEEEEITVRNGDTLFSLIAERDYSGDIRDSVYKTREINGLENNKYLQPGDKIVLAIRKE